MTRRPLLWLVFLLQSVSAGVFVFALLVPLLGLPITYDWRIHESIEIAAAFGLVAGLAMGWGVLRRAQAAHDRMQAQLRVAAGAFVEVMEERFAEWGLTPAEREVALFAIKGLSTAEIAALRGTSEGTVKAQSAAVYRKAGVAGRPQLLSLFIDDLMAEALPGVAPSVSPSPERAGGGRRAARSPAPGHASPPD
jgi:DNA-binding CsgD family transcriptional regulator